MEKRILKLNGGLSELKSQCLEQGFELMDIRVCNKFNTQPAIVTDCRLQGVSIKII